MRSQPSASSHFRARDSATLPARAPHWQIREWHFIGLQLLEFRVKTGEELVVEARANFACADQFVPFVIPDQQRAEVQARALRFGVSANHKLLLMRDLDLDPCAGAPSRLIERFGFFPDQ